MGYAGRDANAQKQSWAARMNRGNLPKGVPVPGSGYPKWRSGYTDRRAGVPSGVSANERLLNHRYRDEGDSGPAYRRQLRRVSERFWRADWADEL